MRICLNCETDISHKRTGAIYCGLKCGDEYRCKLLKIEYKLIKPKNKITYHLKIIQFKTVMAGFD